MHNNGGIHPDLISVYGALTASGPIDDGRLEKVTGLLSGYRSVFFNILEQQGLCPELLESGNGNSTDGVHGTDENNKDLNRTTRHNPETVDSGPLYPSDITRIMVLHRVHALQNTTKPVHNPGYLAADIIDVDWAPRGTMDRVKKFLYELMDDGLLGTEDRGFYDKNSGRSRHSKIYVATPEGVEYLDTGILPKGLPGSAYHRNDKRIPVGDVIRVSIAEPTKIGVLETVYNLTEKQGETISTLQYLANKVCKMKHGSAPEPMKDKVFQIVQYLETRGCMSITPKMIKLRGGKTKHLVYEITEDGIEYLENLSSDSPDTVEIVPDIITSTPQKEGRTAVEDKIPIPIYGVKYDWVKLHADISKEFNTESPLWYTNLDSTEGFSGAVYIRQNDDVFCAAYVDEHNNLIPSPEAISVLFVSKNTGKKPGRHALSSFFETLDDSSGASGSFSKLMSNNIGEVADRLYNGMYRNAGKFTTNKGNLSDRGQLFFDAVIELFGEDNFCVVDSMGKDNTTPYGSWNDIRNYTPKKSVEPVKQKEQITSQKPRKPRTPDQIKAFLEGE